ncbi:MAG: lipopolysaccharide biosynthesis protein RfbH [Agathobacter sp.]|nr:lipopolysaccharide biosynthesis protein RfbH [Agathobacter sp.]
MENTEIKNEINELVKEYYNQNHKKKEEYKPGDRINYSGRVYDENELISLVDSALEFWLTSGHYVKEFEEGLADYLGVRFCSLVNSGSSANLCAFMALTSPSLGKRQIKKGDEVIAVAAAFPTTVSPIVQYGAVPVFIDVTIPQYNIDVSKLESARTDKTKAVFIAHTLGNPFDLKEIREFCDKYELWLIEDNCDALGSEYYIDGEWKKTGTIGDLSTCSFYPPHHITLGEGGAVCTNNPVLHRLVNSFRDWGRDCWCDSGVDDTCKHRFTQQFGELPMGYDHKYVYSHFGYNLKATEMQAAVGCAQLKKLPDFVKVRKENWDYLREKLEVVSDKIIMPEKAENSRPSWFGFLMTVRKNTGFTRDELIKHLENKNIQTRLLFAGNIVKQPCFNEMREAKAGFRVVGTLEATDMIMDNAFWIGVYPGMNKDKLDYMAECIVNFVNEN